MKIKEKEAVSPVIGVILMVAITVVLAAVLYVWVSGFMGGPSTGVTTLAMGEWTQAPGTYNISASPISTSPTSGIKW
ncbi:MAG: type IV pilin N-terminal domain-containing protein, partial [Candidatus Thermoplasmatota archaeon]|nr:type IV pilin N-terminal domain-containing protein [Candidatus Thermoplasmatota archaeon]